MSYILYKGITSIFMISFHRASLIAQLVKNPPAMQKTPVQFLGREEGIGYPFQYSWAFLVAQLVKNCLQCRRPGFDPWVGKILWRRERLPTPVFWPMDSPWGCKESDTTETLSLMIKTDASKNLNFCLVI